MFFRCILVVTLLLLVVMMMMMMMIIRRHTHETCVLMSSIHSNPISIPCSKTTVHQLHISSSLSVDQSSPHLGLETASASAILPRHRSGGTRHRPCLSAVGASNVAIADDEEVEA